MVSPVELNLVRWAHNVIFFSIFLIAYGVFVCANVHESSHKMFNFGCGLTLAGLTGILAGAFRSKCLVHLQVFQLMLVTLVTTHIVTMRLTEHANNCADKATTVSAQHSTIYLETLPGLFVEIGSQVNYVVVIDPNVLAACEKDVRGLWKHTIFLLFTLLISCLVCSWRFLVAIDRSLEDGYVPVTMVDQDDLTMEDMVSVKEVPMPPTQPDAVRCAGTTTLL